MNLDYSNIVEFKNICVYNIFFLFFEHVQYQIFGWPLQEIKKSSNIDTIIKA